MTARRQRIAARRSEAGTMDLSIEEIVHDGGPPSIEALEQLISVALTRSGQAHRTGLVGPAAVALARQLGGASPGSDRPAGGHPTSSATNDPAGSADPR